MECVNSLAAAHHIAIESDREREYELLSEGLHFPIPREWFGDLPNTDPFTPIELEQEIMDCQEAVASAVGLAFG
jgi:hypothetical protein